MKIEEKERTTIDNWQLSSHWIESEYATRTHTPLHLNHTYLNNVHRVLSCLVATFLQITPKLNGQMSWCCYGSFSISFLCLTKFALMGFNNSSIVWIYSPSLSDTARLLPSSINHTTVPQDTGHVCPWNKEARGWSNNSVTVSYSEIRDRSMYCYCPWLSQNGDMGPDRPCGPEGQEQVVPAGMLIGEASTTTLGIFPWWVSPI